MPGIFGLASSAPMVDLSARLAAMSAPMRHQDWYVEHSYEDESGFLAFGRISTGYVNAAPQPVHNESRSFLAVMEGEIYDYRVHRRNLEQIGQRFSGDSHAELLIHGFEQHGIKFFRNLHGKFVAAIWDTENRKLHLINDRFGMKPMYYSHASARILFGSEIKSLVCDPDVSRKTHLRGVAQFFTFGQLLNEDTLFESVRLLAAASCLTYDADADSIRIEQYWRMKGQVCPARSTAESLDRIDAAFSASVDRMCSDTDGLGLSLSGGLDARTLLGVIGPDRLVASLSLGMAGSKDHESAGAMARLLGCRHEKVILGEQFLSEFESHLRNMVLLTDGQYLCQCIVMPTLPIYRELGVRVLLRGHAGELMHMNKAYNLSLNSEAFGLQDEAGLFDWLWRHMQSYMLDGTHGKLFAHRCRAEMEGLARESLHESLRRTAGTDPTPHRIWQMFFEQRSRRETGLSLAEFDSIVETRVPYLDNELIDELFAVPPELKLGDRIQARILAKHRRELLNVVNVNTGARVGAGRLTKKLATVKQKILAKLGVPGYQPYERLGLWLRRELRQLVHQLLLSDRCLDRGIFDPQAVRSAVDDHLANRKNHTYLLLALMIFEVGQQEFVDGFARRSRSPVAV